MFGQREREEEERRCPASLPRTNHVQTAACPLGLGLVWFGLVWSASTSPIGTLSLSLHREARIAAWGPGCSVSQEKDRKQSCTTASLDSDALFSF